MHRVSPIVFVLCAVYGGLAASVFCFSGAFGQFGTNPWRDAGLVTVSVISAFALTYISLLVHTYSARRRTRPGDASGFTWHVMIPCRDEESVIAETVSAARTTFPGLHVWVIDDDSEDATASIVRKLQDFDEKVHLISRRRPDARTGKGHALNAAYRVIAAAASQDPDQRSRTIIGVLDADGFLSGNALDLLSGPDAFGEDTVGAVQLEVWMKNRGDRQPRPLSGPFKNLLGRTLIRMQDIEFRTSNSAMQMLRVKTGTVGMGGNGQFTRLSVLDDLEADYGQPWGKKLSEDYELGLNIITGGHRTHYVPEAHVSQEALPYTRRLLTQRTRWAQGNMECAELLPGLRRSGNLRGAGWAEIHYFMGQPWLLMTNLILGPLLLVLAVIEGRIGFASGEPVEWIVLLAAVFIVLPYFLWGILYKYLCREDITLVAGIFYGFGYLFYVYMTYLYYPRAMSRMASGRTSWAKTARNADNMALPVMSLREELLALPLLDPAIISTLAEELDGAEDFARELVNTFGLIWPRRWANLRLAAAAEDHTATIDALASIRVASEMLGAERLAQTARDLGVHLDAVDYSALRRELPTISVVGEQTVEEIRGRFITA
ncbi:glycosyltransferase family 2 protein [Nesterenkonia jeotgali]|uniref:Cellulose synthase/poly-beta-1,6-N-acetylglucosamine synthase-like glycosyltransferase n=1 Tax=Nesterenkonia jeotgali TaxID=317018 RepID=A0A0W8IFB2_9MICC|nr:glycosyltransferase [Nesterenkonia jeotgali]KUG58600.1 glycosyl transferase [Nesterenkonia jeotgali]MBA8921649.1 cellulose synthase/poly-beta-1,6-N-acetylglucosamine synthase-like glycosyltransferase [Nesterenkonia jeotgali]